MRLDKFLSDAGILSRTESARAAKCGQISVNGVTVRRASGHVDPSRDIVCYNGRRVEYREFTYIMLNKPNGYVSATDDMLSPTVISLLPEELQRIGLFPCGRLDKNTLGLMILTNNGPLSHKLLAPKNHISKVYRFVAERALDGDDIKRLESGVDIGGYVTAPCGVDMISENEGFITLTEGKYHQIKLMLKAVCNKIEYLERVKFGDVELDAALEMGQWRYLTDHERESLESYGAALPAESKKKHSLARNN